MANLKSIEKLKLEKLLDMGSGYVLGFSNNSFCNFILEVSGKNVEEEMYAYKGTSKANRLRAFWELESNYQFPL